LSFPLTLSRYSQVPILALYRHAHHSLYH